jgi:Transposase
MPFAKAKPAHRWATSVPQLGVAEATFYVWKKKYAHLGMSKLHRLRQLEEENTD